jgi:tetratricopeptide (TPR) repeat protein
MLARGAVASVAVVVLAWLGVMERDARLQARGVAAAGRGDVERAESDLLRARFLNPDTNLDMNRVLVYRASGRLPEARALVEDVLRREPDNLAAWGALYGLTRERDPAAAQRALDALRRLDPVSVARRGPRAPR